jgi:hypothetical protein
MKIFLPVAREHALVFYVNVSWSYVHPLQPNSTRDSLWITSNEGIRLAHIVSMIKVDLEFSLSILSMEDAFSVAMQNIYRTTQESLYPPVIYFLCLRSFHI